MRIYFFPNGNTAACDGPEDMGHQVPELQEPWLLLYAKFLESKGVDPTKQEYTLPNGRDAKVVKVDAGYNWEVR